MYTVYFEKEIGEDLELEIVFETDSQDVVTNYLVLQQQQCILFAYQFIIFESDDDDDDILNHVRGDEWIIENNKSDSMNIGDAVVVTDFIRVKKSQKRLCYIDAITKDRVLLVGITNNGNPSKSEHQVIHLDVRHIDKLEMHGKYKKRLNYKPIHNLLS